MNMTPDVICLGEALIDFIPLDTGVCLMDVTGFKKAPGGAPANVAAGISKLGGRSAFIGKVGEDAFGRYLEQVFISGGVDTSHMLFDKSAKTGLAFVSLTSDGVPEFMFYRNPSADMLIRPDEIDMAFVKSARAFHYGSITLISEPSKSATETAIRYASETGQLISYDPNLRKPLWESDDQARTTMLEAMAYPHVVKVSEEELEFLTGCKDLLSGADTLLSDWENIQLIAVTRGAKGCFFRSRSHYGELPGFKVKVEDTTGAGDGFVAGMLTRLLALTTSPDGISALSVDALSGIFTYANAVAALTTTKKGAITALPSKEAVEKFITANKA
ncbi:MAG: PfkB family carbohydrate kinase [Armatimonadota bacterium]